MLTGRRISSRRIVVLQRKSVLHRDLCPGGPRLLDIEKAISLVLSGHQRLHLKKGIIPSFPIGTDTTLYSARLSAFWRCFGCLFWLGNLLILRSFEEYLRIIRGGDRLFQGPVAVWLVFGGGLDRAFQMKRGGRRTTRTSPNHQKLLPPSARWWSEAAV